MFVLLDYQAANNKEKKMAIIHTTLTIPGNALGQAQLATNLTALRDALRAAGRNANLAGLVSGGVPGAMVLSTEVADWDAWASMTAEGIPDNVQKVVSEMPASGGIGQQASTMIELPALETEDSAIPRGVMMVSRIKVHPGKASIAYDMVTKSKEILTGLGATVRIFNVVHGMETSILSFNQYFESPAAMVACGNKMMADPEWQSHWNNPARIGNTEVVSQAVWSFVG
jgi:hypothetical protein